MTYIPVLIRQNPIHEGGPIGWQNCASCCTAMCIAFETAGALKPTGGDVRACTLEESGLPDTTGGTSASQNVDAAKRCWQITLDQSVMDFEKVWSLGARSDTMLSISISYAVIRGTVYDASPGFTGYHQVCLSGGFVYDPLADGRRPSIPKGPKTWPKALLRRAAGKFSNIGEGRAAVIVAHAPAVKPTRYSVAFDPGAFWVYLTDGTRVRQSFVKKTSAPSTAPFTVPWAGGRKRLVEITAGVLAGKRVEPTATHLRLVTV